MTTAAAVVKPQRWSEPFGPVSPGEVRELLAVEPFSRMDRAAFPPTLPLEGILANDCRVNEYQPGDVVFRRGDYGNSAFLLLSGHLQVLMGAAPLAADQAAAPRPLQWLQGLSALVGWARGRGPDPGRDAGSAVRTRETGNGPRMFVQDVPAILAEGDTQRLEPGQIFGELSAINRSPRPVSVIAPVAARALEIRWQGLRDLMQRDSALREHIQRLYRERSLVTHLRETPLLAGLDGQTIDRLAEAVEFESYGTLQWTHQWRSASSADVADRIRAEPLIARQGDYCDGLLLIASGFARVTRAQGHGEQTIEYLGRGGVFGLRELAHNHATGQQRPWQLSLRATGYLDVLRIPVPVVDSLILPRIGADRLPPRLPPVQRESSGGTRRLAQRRPGLPADLLETVVEHRLMNGTEAMVIDLNRCTRCDDCVRACAATHDGLPRFSRSGPVHDHLMFAHACMHCADPVCMIGCPTGAIAREEATGVVTINDRTCIGCGTCAGSCPYNNIQMVPVTGRKGTPLVDQQSGLPVLQATKCDLCQGSAAGPACQRACPHDALVRIDLTRTAPLREWLLG